MGEKKIIIAIDGHSSTGKSTVAKQLAKKLHYIYVDTGAMYRAIALYAMRKGYIDESHFDQEKLEKDLPEIVINFEINPDTGLAEALLNNENIEKEIRTLKVSKHVSKIAAVSAVRRKLVEQQNNMGIDKGIVMDGRDIGTVVFPNAELKLFMTATAKDRAERRYIELKERGENVTYEDVLMNVVNRDHIDSTRKDSPLRKASDAIKIDNSNLTLQQQFDQILKLAQTAIENA
ncbi:(d)CMP kinase [Aquimarina sp. AD10]|uniref:Cytidylate kinase n=1 Tax=Aquimarina aggregata TaxID=1642818 RepID=A0A163C6T1_9FLAO|nr:MULTISPECIES: (d)CMP kinase [Aquimarina]AXT59905.1 (d)CMP kinase [Aquimarina sp. AD10]KZS42105.1 cytidylate kinase [Aquimarina aggregata]RKN00177.1 (d)CMP kinase [Aquimarina sp. AD10]